VALVGEEHVKSKEDSTLGKNLLTHFKTRGLEGVNTNGSCLSAGLARILVPLYRCFRYLPDSTEGSTIDDAVAQSSLLDITGIKTAIDVMEKLFTDILMSRIKVVTQNGEMKFIDELSEENRNEISYIIPMLDHQTGIQEKNVTLQEIFLNRNNIHSFFQWDLQKPTNFWLEANHTPDIAEKIASAYFPLSIGICTAAVCTLIPYVNSIFPKYSARILQASAGAIVASSMVSSYYEEKSNDEHLAPVVLDPINGLVHGRNETMVKNLSQLLVDFPEIKNILVVVGMKHVPGMARLLIRNHSFEETPLE
jgi:hypothetical protein